MFPEGRIFEFMIVGVVALIVVGPKDLPILMRRVGRFLAQMRAMAAEFRASFDEMARQSELDELRREVEALRTGQALQTAMGPAADIGVHDVFDDIHANLRNGHEQTPPASDHQTPAAPEVEPDQGPPVTGRLAASTPTAEQAGSAPSRGDA